MDRGRVRMRWIRASGLAAAALVMAAGGIADAQVRTIDPNRAIDGDLSRPQPATRNDPPAVEADMAVDPGSQAATPDPDTPAPAPTAAAPLPPVAAPRTTATTVAADTYAREDLLAAGEGVFGKGAQGLAGIIEKILKEQGRPNAYIAGREASGAFVIGVRYGSGVMSHKVEGQQPVYWTGPSVGFDVGGDANKVFVLVYNLHDTEELFNRFPAAEGRLYFVGGFAATYLRRGNIVLIPVRLGVGWRAGVNVGYMKFSHKNRWLPF